MHALQTEELRCELCYTKFLLAFMFSHVLLQKSLMRIAIAR